MTKPKSFEAFFNGLPHLAKIKIANRRVQQLDLDVQWCYAIGYYGHSSDVSWRDDWYLFWLDDLIDRRDRWVDVRDRLVWDNEEVVLT